MRVGFFVTCLVDLMRPSIGFAAIRLLEAGGAEVFVPPTQTCCGQPAYNSGDRADTRALAAKLIGEFEGCDYVVAPSGSCAAWSAPTIRELLRRRSGDEGPRRRAGGEDLRTDEFPREVLSSICAGSHSAGTVTYHDSCSGLRETGRQSSSRVRCWRRCRV